MSAYSVFKDSVLAFINRTSTPFTSAGAADMILVAMNDARRGAQMEYSFNLNKRPAFGKVSLLPISMLVDFDADPTGSGATVVVKEIEACYEYSTSLVGVTTVYYRTAKIPYWTHGVFQREMNLSATVFGSNTQVIGSLQNNTQFVYRQGVNVYHSTSSTQTFQLFDVVEFLPDHDGGAGTDIFFTYFQGWMRYATLAAMNQYLKDGERFNVDETILNGMWDAVKQYDAQQAASTGMINLD